MTKCCAHLLKSHPFVHSAVTPVDSCVHQSSFECRLVLLFLSTHAYLKVNQGVTVRPGRLCFAGDMDRIV